MFKIIANDKNIIPYRKELNLITGGALESIFLAQLLYWYEVNDCNEFFKFREPCEHSLYKEGDSWVEELGFSIKIINRIIKVFKKDDIYEKKFKGLNELKIQLKMDTNYIYKKYICKSS